MTPRPEPCRCPGPGPCPRYPHLHPRVEGRVYELCAGIKCTPELSDQYRAAWDIENARRADTPESNAPGPNAMPGPPPVPRGVCRYFGDSPLDRGGCGSCQAKWVCPCDIYGRCSPAGWHPRVKRCEGCVHHTARDADEADPTVRRFVLVNEHGPTEALLVSAAIENLHREYPRAFVTAVEGPGAELLDQNPDVVTAEPVIDGTPVAWERIVMRSFLADSRIENLEAAVGACCEHLGQALGVSVPLGTNRPRVELSPEERALFSPVRPSVGNRLGYWLVDVGVRENEGGWRGTDYQRIVDLLGDTMLFVQVGDTPDTQPSLRGTVDLRGRVSLRQLAHLVFHAHGGLGPPTLLWLLCAAFEKPYICVPDGQERGEPGTRVPAAIDRETLRPEWVAAEVLARG